jgi:hypothetical protein
LLPRTQCLAERIEVAKRDTDTGVDQHQHTQLVTQWEMELVALEVLTLL